MLQLLLNPAILLLFVAALICAALALYAWNRRAAMPGAWAFALLMLATAEWALGYALELWAKNLDTKVVWTYVRSLGMATSPVLWLIFALYYADAERWLSRRRLTLLLSSPFPFLLLIFTNPWHHLVWRGVELLSTGPLLVLHYDLSPGYWVAVTYAYLSVLLGSALLVIMAARESHLYRWQAVLLVVAAFLPLAGHVVTLVWSALAHGLNLAPFAFALSGLLIVLNTYGFRFLEIMPVAYRIVVESMNDGVIVLGSTDRVVSLNPAAEHILGREANEVVRHPAEKALAAWPALVAFLASGGEARETICLPGDPDPRYYELTVSSLWGWRGWPAGRVVVLRDVTRRHQLQSTVTHQAERLQRQQEALLALSHLHREDEKKALQCATEHAAQALRVTYVSAWLLEGDTLRCLDRYDARTDTHTAGERLRADDYPAYFAALATGLAVDAHDASQDPRTKAFAETGYLQALDITSMLDAPIHRNGEVVGVVCHEHTGPARTWQADEVSFAAGVAEHVARLLERAERLRTQAQLRRRDAILEAVTFTAQQLLQVGDWGQAMKEVLARLGQDAEVSRAYVFENHTAPDGTLLTSQRYEWVAPGVTPQIDTPDLQNFPWIDGGFGRWLTTLSRGETIAGPVREFPERERVVLEPRDVRSILVLPVFVGEKWWGFIGFDECQSERDWSPTEREVLKAAASVIGVAIRRRRIEERLQRLATVATEVTASLDLTRVLDTIATSVLELVQATDVHIYLYDPEKETFTFGTALWEDGRRIPAVPQVRPHGLTATVARSGRRMVINDVSSHPLFAEPAARAWGLKSIAGFPLRRADRVVGVLNVAFLHRPHHFTDNELRVLGLLADQAAIAIENARLVEAEREARQQAETLQKVAGVLGSVLEPGQLLELVLQELKKVVPYDSASVMLVQEQDLRVVAARGFPESTKPLEVTFSAAEDPFFQEVSRTQRPLILEDARSDPRFRRLGGTDYVRGWICAPLLARDQVIGLLTVDSRKPGAYDQRHARVVQTFAHHAAMAMENARLHEEVHRQAITDGLTGLYNYRYFYEVLSKELVRSQRYQHPCSLIILDLDALKHYNDRYGHLAGDDLLRELAGVIRRVTRHADTAARYGGDEFALILPETEASQALALAQRLWETIRAHEFTLRRGQEVGRITASIGVATYPKHARDAEGLVEAADLALLHAKAEGKVRVCVYEEGEGNSGA